MGKEAAQNILAFRFANGLFEPIWNRGHIDHVQIDVPETLSVQSRAGFYENTGAFRDMVVTHLFQVLAFMAMEPPTSLDPRSISEEKNKVFRSMLPIDVTQVVRGQYDGYRSSRPSMRDRQLAVGRSPLLPANRQEHGPGRQDHFDRLPRTAQGMFPVGSGIGAHGPDHLTFDLADSSKLSLSFYGKRPGPGMKLDKLSLQFALHETGHETDVLEAYERLIHDAMIGDHTLFTAAEDIERLWDLSTPLLEDPPDVESYSPGSWGPEGIHDLIAPSAWRLPFDGVGARSADRLGPPPIGGRRPSRRLRGGRLGWESDCRPPASSTRPPGSDRAGTGPPAP